ncbi:ribonuclease H-like protein, partial [Dendrothele bispora CBS 962.96]
YTDGSCKPPSGPNARAGAGVFLGPHNAMNCAKWVTGVQTNNRGELYAILVALQLCPMDRSVVIHSDSEYAINSITTWAPMNAKCGWSCANGDLLRVICSWIRARSARVVFKWVKGHAQNAHNEAADQLADAG